MNKKERYKTDSYCNMKKKYIYGSGQAKDEINIFLDEDACFLGLLLKLITLEANRRPINSFLPGVEHRMLRQYW